MLDIDQTVGYSAAFISVGQNGAAQMIAAGQSGKLFKPSIKYTFSRSSSKTYFCISLFSRRNIYSSPGGTCVILGTTPFDVCYGC